MRHRSRRRRRSPRTGTSTATDGALGLATGGFGLRRRAGSPAGKLTWTQRRQCRARGRDQGAPARRRRRASSISGSAPPQPIASATRSASRRAATSASPPAGAKFANVANFRGFPHMPGNDFVLRLAAPGRAGHGRRELVPMSVTPRSHIVAAARTLDRHALSPSGLAQGRRLRLPRPGARRLARRDGRRARGAAALYARTGRRPGARHARRGRAAASRRAAEPRVRGRRRAALPLARAACRPSTARSRPRATR